MFKFSDQQSANFVRTKAGDAESLTNIKFENVEAPSSFFEADYPPGSCNPDEFKGCQFDMRSGLIWSEVCDLERLEKEASLVLPMTGADISDMDDAERFRREDPNRRANLFLTEHGRAVAKGTGKFLII